jgi:hypothetical protein
MISFYETNNKTQNKGKIHMQKVPLNFNNKNNKTINEPNLSKNK